MTNTTTAAAAVKFTIEYETMTCSRCGGSGHYSRCAMYGTTCFKCSGRKRVTTAAGRRAADAVDAFMLENFGKLVDDVAAGERVKIDGKLRTITSVERDGAGSCSYTDSTTGETVTKRYVMLNFTKRYAGGTTENVGHGFIAGTRVQLAVGGDDWLRVVEFARTIRKGCTIVETPVAAK